MLDTNYFFASETPLYLLAILNSRLILYWINSEDTQVGGGGAYRHYKYNIEKLHIPRVLDSASGEIIRLMNTYLSTLDKYVLGQIDQIVFQCYNLSNEEIGFIQSQYNQ